MAEYESWDIAGYGGDGSWADVEHGARELNPETYPDGPPDWVDEIVLDFVDAAGDHHYITVWGPWEDWDSLYDIVDDVADAYSGEFA